jgi:GMP synthase (glutamine-hydrolysing)
MITKACHHINRVVYVLGKKILDSEITQVTRTTLTQDIVDKARACDYHAMVIMKRHNAYSSISQMPVVLIPIQFDRQIYLNDHEEMINNENERVIPLTRLRPIASSFQHSVVLRTFITKDFMTGRPAVPGETFPLEMLDEMCQTIQSNVPGISRVLYDLTSKPPGRQSN